MVVRFGVMSRDGRVTIPSEIRDELGLQEGDPIAFVLEDSKVHLQRRGNVQVLTGMGKSRAETLGPEQLRKEAEEALAQGRFVEWSAGIFGRGQPPLSAEELRELAEIAIAEDVNERLK